MKKILLVLILLCLLFCFSCANVPIDKDEMPNQNIEQETGNNKQPNDNEESSGGNKEDNQDPNDSENVEQPGGVNGTPVPPIQNGGDFEFD